MKNHHLEALRKSIDNVDEALLCMLAERFRLTEAVGVLKKEYTLPAEDSGREEQQKERYRQIAEKSGLDPDFALAFHRLLVESSKKRHRRISGEAT